MIRIESFGRIDGQEVRSFTLSNADGLTARVIEHGATLTELHVPDGKGVPGDVVLGFDRLEPYLSTKAYLGRIAGRYGNRIRGGRFPLDGRTVELVRNEGGNTLHGGASGFDSRLWRGEPDEAADAVRFSLRSPDGDQGFPGTLDLTVTYRLVDGGMEVEMAGRTDRPTVCNPVQHAYWNLAGHGSGDVLRQEVAIAADFYTPVDAELLPTGEVLAVAGTAFDFREPKPIGRDIAAVPSAGPAGSGRGYDHNWVLRGPAIGTAPAVRAFDPESGRVLELRTTEPGVQFYTGGYLDGTDIGKGDTPYRRYAGFTLETQKWPDSPNQPHFPSARLDPGETYRHGMAFRFSSA